MKPHSSLNPDAAATSRRCGKQFDNLMKNLTPHAVRVFNPDGTLAAEIPPSGMIARVSQTRELVGQVEGLPIYRSVMGAPTVVRKDGSFVSPSDLAGEKVIVSLAWKQAILAGDTAADWAGRVFSPGELKRDITGQPIGCVGLDG